MQLAEWTPGLVHDLPFDTQNGTDTPLAAALHPAGRLLAIRSSRFVQLLDLLSERRIGSLTANDCIAVAFSESGDQLIIVTKTAMQIVQIQRPPDDNAIAVIVIGPPHTILLPPLDAAVVSADGLKILATTQLTPLVLSEFRVADGELVRQVGPCGAGQYPAGTGQGRLRVMTGWHTTSATILSEEGGRLATIDVPKHCVPSASLNSKYFTTAAEEYIQFWNTQTFQREWRFPLDFGVIGPRVAFHPTEPLFSVRLLPNRLGFVDPESRSMVARVDESQESWVLFSLFTPDGERLVDVCSNPHCIRVWQVGELRRALEHRGLNWKSPAALLTSLPSRNDKSVPASHPGFVLKTGLPMSPDGSLESRKNAIEAARLQLEKSPDDAFANNNLSWNLLLAPTEFSENATALELSRKCNEAVKGAAAYRNTLGLALYRNQLWDEARELLLLNLDQSAPDQLTLDLVILSMTALQKQDRSTGESYFVWAKKNFADHPPISPADRIDTRQLLDELEELRRHSVVAPRVQ